MGTVVSIIVHDTTD